ncbi:MAG TPA: HoxN/HupN/NixA family nickel/cobalt transporter [Stellaceae bacterium]|jgi:high-affinity nickel-transport protein|nr:HoxN/HupN/NixA family nickel/cobalt transporter [Stellaceae bacterium]
MNLIAACLGNRGRTAVICASVMVANVLAWGWAWPAVHGNPVLLGTAFLAYTFGLRHAVDADHIAAIDNATRKLIEAECPASATGLFFSLGHATVVILASLVIVLTTVKLQTSFQAWKPLASTVATGLSAAALFALAIANTFIFVSVLRVLTAMRQGGQPLDLELRRMTMRPGLLGHLLRGLFRLISKSWHMYPLGFLFGLGFDTATEIGVLGVSATQAAHGLPLPMIMVFPVLFTAGMVLVDTLDAVLMVGAYRWASIEPIRKLYYNLGITLISVIVAFVIGGVELLGLFAGDNADSGIFWKVIGLLNEHFTAIGVTIIGVFAVSWGISMLIWRSRIAPSS